MIPAIFLGTVLQASPVVGYTGMQPVRISSCELKADPTTTTNAFAIRYSGADSVEISFVNHAVKPISLVSIDVTDGSVTSRVVDKGTFSNGVAIDHRFDARNFPSAFASVSCSVQSVLFADGTAWMAQ